MTKDSRAFLDGIRHFGLLVSEIATSRATLTMVLIVLVIPPLTFSCPAQIF